MRIDIWTDLVCPWCYVGKRRFEKAFATFEHRGDVQVVHRSFQLNPAAPAGQTSPRRDALMSKYGLSEAQVDAMNARMEQTAAEEGLEYKLSGGVTGNTFDAHRVLHLAHDRGRQDEVIERLYRAYFTEQRSLFDHDSLVELAGEAGLDRDEVRRVLTGDEYADAVARDIAEARALGASGVPFFVIDQRYGISGAQPPEVFAQALERAWADTHRRSSRLSVCARLEFTVRSVGVSSSALVLPRTGVGSWPRSRPAGRGAQQAYGLDQRARGVAHFFLHRGVAIERGVTRRIRLVITHVAIEGGGRARRHELHVGQPVHERASQRLGSCRVSVHDDREHAIREVPRIMPALEVGAYQTSLPCPT